MIKTYINGVLQESGGGGGGAVDSVNTKTGVVTLNQDEIPDGTTYKQYSQTEKTKLSNITGTNTGDETASTIINKIGDGSKINSSYLPSYVDDVLEFANVASFPATGEVGKIYIALDVNLTYRWGGSGYVEISPSIALGETSATAYRGDRGASAYAHSILTSGTNPHNTTFANIASKPTTIAGYGITDGVTLVGSETLTNKTLTAPVLNTEITGTGITTTGEANKLIKTSSLGNISLTQSVDGVLGINLNNSFSGTNSFSGISCKSNLENYISIGTYSSTRAAVLMGKVTGSSSILVSQGTNHTGMILGTLNNSPITIGTNNTERLEIGATGAIKVASLAGAGDRIVIADASGNLSAISRLNTINVTGLTTSYQLTAIPAVSPLSYIWRFTSSTGVATLESTHNLFIGNDILSQFLGCTVTEVTPNTNFSFRLGDSVLEIGIDSSNGNVYLKRNSGTVTDLTIERITQNI